MNEEKKDTKIYEGLTPPDQHQDNQQTVHSILAQVKNFFETNKVAIEAAGYMKPEVLDKLKEAATLRPSTWSARTVAPYYNEKNGKKVLEVFKTIFNNPETDMYFDCHKMRVNVKTFLQQFHQGWRWLREQHPDQEIRDYYTKLKDDGLLRIDKNGNRGVRMAIIQLDTNEILACGVPVKSLNSRITWKEELDKFIENAKPGHKKVFKGVILNFSDKEYIRTVIAQLPEFAIIEIDDNRFSIAMVGESIDELPDIQDDVEI